MEKNTPQLDELLEKEEMGCDGVERTGGDGVRWACDGVERTGGGDGVRWACDGVERTGGGDGVRWTVME